MEFYANDLQRILNRQEMPVCVFDDLGRSREVSPREACRLAVSKEFVGIGHTKRIRYIRPERVYLGWKGGSHTIKHTPIKNNLGEITTGLLIVEPKGLVFLGS